MSTFTLKTDGNLVMKTFVGSQEKLNHVKIHIYNLFRIFLNYFLKNFIEKNH